MTNCFANVLCRPCSSQHLRQA